VVLGFVTFEVVVLLWGVVEGLLTVFRVEEGVVALDLGVFLCVLVVHVVEEDLCVVGLVAGAVVLAVVAGVCVVVTGAVTGVVAEEDGEIVVDDGTLTIEMVEGPVTGV